MTDCMSFIPCTFTSSWSCCGVVRCAFDSQSAPSLRKQTILVSADNNLFWSEQMWIFCESAGKFCDISTINRLRPVQGVRGRLETTRAISTAQTFKSSKLMFQTQTLIRSSHYGEFVSSDFFAVSNFRPLEPSPRPGSLRRPIQRSGVPLNQRVYWKARVTRAPSRGISSSNKSSLFCGSGMSTRLCAD